MGMFDKLVHKGKKMAGEYLRDQLAERSGGRRPGNDGGRSGYDGGWGRNGYDDGGRGGYGDDRRGYGYDRRDHNENRGDCGTAQPRQDQPGAYGQPDRNGGQGSSEDQAAIAKYRYMLRTAPPEDMERAHAEAFARLNPQQRRLLQAELSEQLPASECPRSDAPQDLARSATRAELGRPGIMEKILGGGGRPGGGRGRGMGGLAAGAAGGIGAGLLAGVAGAFIGTAVAGPLLDGFSGIGEELSGAAEGLGDTVSGLGESASAMGEDVIGAGGEMLGAGENLTQGLGDQAGGMFDGFLNGGGGGFFGGDQGGDWEF